MNRRRLEYLAVFLVLVVLLVGWSTYFHLRRAPISQAGCNRIIEGMSMNEVEKVFGGPPGKHHDRQVDINRETNFLRVGAELAPALTRSSS